jgi:septal ring factor EnvC (AmiA/AmiB activator)
LTAIPPPLPDPPQSYGRWLDLISSAVQKGLVPFLLLGFFVWWSNQQMNNLRQDLKDSRAETQAIFSRCIDKAATSQAAVTAAVASVKTEIAKTTEAVKAVTETPTPTPPAPPPR